MPSVMIRWKGIVPVFLTKQLIFLGIATISFCLGANEFCRRTEEDQATFSNEAGWGYLAKKAESVTDVCVGEAWLKCTESLEFCVGNNLRIDFPTTAAMSATKKRYNTEVLSSALGGAFGGHCKMKNGFLQRHINQKKRGAPSKLHPLQSWAPELRYFQTDNLPEMKSGCDIVVSKPTVLMKLDLTSNMYHHFCDFFNLYASMALNSSLFKEDTTQSTIFGIEDDTRLLAWESTPYMSPFSEVMETFSKNEVWNLQTFAGQRVCFEGTLMLPLLPRMTKGLYYNTPLTDNGCSNSSLFTQFSAFITDRLNIESQAGRSLQRPLRNKRIIRVTILDREETKYRRILNLVDLLEAAEEDEEAGNFEYDVRIVRFGGKSGPSFRQQLTIVSQTDVLVGVHGAGLTHLMFLPQKGAVIELDDCGDACYKNLARLNGIKYFTMPRWASQIVPQEGGGLGRPKFANFAFQPREFRRTLDQAAEYVDKNDAAGVSTSHL